jgi:hypothetical protein
MSTLSIHYSKNKDDIQILPTFWKDESMPPETYENISKYNETVFDAAAIGIYLLGKDPFHTDGVIKKNLSWYHSAIDCTKQTFEWKTDETGKRKPYIWNGEKWLLINNLHVHAKNLIEGLSLPDLFC